MADDLIRHSRRSIRLKNYDYSQAGEYFVTICTLNRVHLFGEVIDGEMRLNANGRIVRKTWDDLPQHYTNIELDTFVVIPNHIHAVILIEERDEGAGFKPAPTRIRNHSLSEVIRGFKTFSARRINEHRNTPGAIVWQRNYWEHVIRDESSLHAIRRYIRENPQRWDFDRYNANAIGLDPLAKQLWQILQTSIRRSGG